MKREARRAQHVAGIAMSNTRPRVKSRVLSSIKGPSKFQVTFNVQASRRKSGPSSPNSQRYTDAPNNRNDHQTIN
jgi:hypothetical protein